MPKGTYVAGLGIPRPATWNVTLKGTLMSVRGCPYFAWCPHIAKTSQSAPAVEGSVDNRATASEAIAGNSVVTSMEWVKKARLCCCKALLPPQLEFLLAGRMIWFASLLACTHGTHGEFRSVYANMVQQ